MRLVLLGPPAAGKGTQGKLLANHYHIPHISTGSMFRESMRAESEVGQQVRQCIEQGELVPDELALLVVKERLSQPDCRQGFVLDGFPRTVPQAASLDSVLKLLGIELDGAVNIQIPESESIHRIANRRVCGQCGSTTRADVIGEVCQDCGGPLIQRPDDTPDTARNRLVVYLAQTKPVSDYYGQRECLVTVDGQQPINSVYKQITHQLDLLCAKPHSKSTHTEVAE